MRPFAIYIGMALGARKTGTWEPDPGVTFHGHHWLAHCPPEGLRSSSSEPRQGGKETRGLLNKTGTRRPFWPVASDLAQGLQS